MATVVVNGIEKSVNDSLSYKACTLANGLVAVLASDPTADKAGAALSVGVGYFSDPDDIPGLAHFCEHMLFLGTEKYPDENHYMNELAQLGGKSNAFTQDELTNYIFDVAHPHLRRMLDVFSAFFVAPLFTQTATSRELQAVHNEHQKNLQNDAWRMYQLEKSVSSPLHPFSKFATGDRDTLETAPLSKNIDVRAALLAFHKEHYTAPRMRLVVLGRESLEELEVMVTEMFSGVPRGAPPPPRAFLPPPFPAELLSRRLSVVSIRDSVTVEVTWPLPSTQTLYRSDPTRILAHCIGHEGRRSILASLKARGLANELSAGLSQQCSDFSLFKVSVDCAPTASVDAVLDSIFSYTKLLRESPPDRELFENVRAEIELKTRFQSKPNAYEFCMRTATTMQRVPLEHCLVPDLLREFRPDLLAEFARLLTPDRALVLVARQRHEDGSWLRERWYSTQYRDAKLEWPLSNLPLIDPPLGLPMPNELLPTRFDLACGSESRPFTDTLRPPVLLSGTPRTLRVWHKMDMVHRLPKASFSALVKSAQAYSSPRASALAEIGTMMVKEALAEYAYQAQIAGLHWSLANAVRGMVVSLSGFNDKLPTLLQRVLGALCDRATYLDEAIFARVLDRYQRQLVNLDKEEPYQLAVYEASVLLNIPRWHVHEKLAALKRKAVTTAELASFMHALNESCASVDALCIGNVSRMEALSWAETLWQHLGFDATNPVPRPRVVALPNARVALKLAPRDPDNVNSAVEFLCQFGVEAVRRAALVYLLAHIGEEPCFNRLRTNRQLGYIVHLGVRREWGVLHLRMIVQSSTVSCSVIEAAMEEFLVALRDEVVAPMSAEVLLSNIDAVTSKLTAKDLSIEHEAKRWWGEVDEGSLWWDRWFQITAEMRRVSKQDLVDFINRFVLGSEKRWLLAEVGAHDASQLSPSVGVEVLTSSSDVKEFQERCGLFGAVGAL